MYSLHNTVERNVAWPRNSVPSDPCLSTWLHIWLKPRWANMVSITYAFQQLTYTYYGRLIRHPCRLFAHARLLYTRFKEKTVQHLNTPTHLQEILVIPANDVQTTHYSKYNWYPGKVLLLQQLQLLLVHIADKLQYVTHHLSEGVRERLR